MIRGVNGLYYDNQNSEVYDVGSERFVDVQLAQYGGPESGLEKAEQIFDHGNQLISSDYLEKHGWDTFEIDEENIQQPYYYGPKHRIKDQIKKSTIFGPESTLESSLSEIQSMIGSGYRIKYTDSQTQKEYPDKFGRWVKKFNKKNEKSERFCRDENEIKKRFNVISLEVTKLGY